MPKYVKGEEKTYFSAVIASLVVLAAAIAFFVYSIVTGPADQNLKNVLIDNENLIKLNPGPDLAQPKNEPDIEQPTNPPPG